MLLGSAGYSSRGRWMHEHARRGGRGHIELEHGARHDVAVSRREHAVIEIVEQPRRATLGHEPGVGPLARQDPVIGNTADRPRRDADAEGRAGDGQPALPRVATTNSTSTVSPLKYALVRAHWLSASARIVCWAPSSCEVIRRRAPSRRGIAREGGLGERRRSHAAPGTVTWRETSTSPGVPPGSGPESMTVMAENRSGAADVKG